MTSDQQLRLTAGRARGVLARLGVTLDRIADGDNPADRIEWLDADGRISVWAQDFEEIPRLLDRLRDYVRDLMSHDIEESISGCCADFLDIVERCQVRDLRNMIEHQADYVAGRGHRLDMPDRSAAHLVHGYTLDPYQIRSLEVFGKEFDIGGPVELAFMLYEPLGRLVD